MSDDRYEIRSKIGEGGVGVVYRAFDHHLNREVAIKRVLADGGYENQEEATEAMLKEATALCAVQHPHIVTVFDAGIDKDGPYVVMELLPGRTLDEMIERGILTIEDFREVALQSTEALIAAQDLDLVHRDIKPTNLMISWLPSGRFQVKLVDFGLAKFSPKPSLQTIDHGDSVFGSIHFMAPEQFERIPLDKRTDMYSIGCVYYYCLAGRYPFDGQNAALVMNAHLQNTVTPISELRPDLPAWLADWVMWHLSRKMEDRPANARESLKKFLMTENNPEAGTPEVPTDPNQAIPAAVPAPPVSSAVNTETAPQPIQPPADQAPSIHTAAQQVKAPVVQARPRLVIPSQEPAAAPAPVAPEPVAVAPIPEPVAAAPAPQLQAPAAVTPPPAAPAAAPQVTVTLSGTPAQPAPATPVVTPAVVAAAPVLMAGSAMPSAPPAQPAAAPSPLGQTQPGGIGIGSVAPMQKKGISNAVKAMIATTLVAALIVAGFVFAGKSNQNEHNETLNRITAPFSDPANPPEDIPLSQSDVQTLMDELTSTTVSEKGNRATFLQALKIGKATDGTDIGAMVAAYAKDVNMESSLRVKFFQVVGGRGEESALPSLIEYASKTDDTASGQAALNATRNMASTSNFASLLAIITNSSSSSIKNSAVDVLSKAVGASENPGSFAKGIIGTYNNASDEDSKVALLRLAGSAGGDDAAGLITKALEGDNPKLKVAGVYALRNWPDDSQFDKLFEYASSEENDRLRGEAFTAMVNFLKDSTAIDEDDLSIYWSDVAGIATGETEQRLVVDSMVSQNGAWADDILDYFIENGDSDRVQFRAEKAKTALQTRMKRSKRSGNSDEEEEEEEEEAEEEEEEEEEDEE